MITQYPHIMVVRCFWMCQGEKTDAMLKKIQDRLENQIDGIHDKEFAGQRPKHTESKYGPVHAIEEANLLEKKLALARKKLEDYEAGRPSGKEVKEEAKLQSEIDAEREKMMGDDDSKKEGGKLAAAQSKVGSDKAVAKGQEQGQVAEVSATGVADAHAQGKEVQPEESPTVRHQKQNMARLYYKAGSLFWKANPTSLFRDWVGQQKKWDDSFSAAAAGQEEETHDAAAATQKKVSTDYVPLTGTAYTHAFMSKFESQLREIKAVAPEDLVARALYLAAERQYMDAHPLATESDWQHEKVKLDSASPAAILSWRVGDETALYSQEAADLYKQAQEEEAKAREMYYKSQESFWMAEHQASYEDWKRSQQEWNYWYSNPYAVTPTENNGPASDGQKLAQMAYRERFTVMYSREMKQAHADSPMKYVAQNMYIVAQHSFFAAKPGASLSDWEDTKSTWDMFYNEDKKLDAEQKQIDVMRGAVIERTLTKTSQKASRPQVCLCVYIYMHVCVCMWKGELM
jgi:hypothetical protein